MKTHVDTNVNGLTSTYSLYTTSVIITDKNIPVVRKKKSLFTQNVIRTQVRRAVDGKVNNISCQK